MYIRIYYVFLIILADLLHYQFPTKLYPAGKNKEEKRCFHLKWMQEFDWLLYSKSKDAAFCSYCVKYASKWKFDQFAATGYSNWKKAMNTDGGFKKHLMSVNHKDAVAKACEHQQATQTNKEIHTMLEPNVLADRRFYFSKIINTVRFIARNGLPFRGDYDKLLGSETGNLFNSFICIHSCCIIYS